LINGGKEIFGEVGDNGGNGLEVLLSVARIQAPKKIASREVVSLGLLYAAEAGLRQGLALPAVLVVGQTKSQSSY